MYEKVLKLDPNDIEATFNLALAYLQQKSDLNYAIECFKRVIVLPDPLSLYKLQKSKALYNLGMLYDRLGDVSKSHLYYQ